LECSIQDGFEAVATDVPYAGAYSALLASFPSSDTRTLTQTIATNPGQCYGVSFYMREGFDLSNPQTPDDSLFQVTFGGVTIFNFVNQAAHAFTQYYNYVPATAASSDLVFTTYNTPDFFFLDNVIVDDGVTCPSSISSGEAFDIIFTDDLTVIGSVTIDLGAGGSVDFTVDLNPGYTAIKAEPYVGSVKIDVGYQLPTGQTINKKNNFVVSTSYAACDVSQFFALRLQTLHGREKARPAWAQSRVPGDTVDMKHLNGREFLRILDCPLP